MTDQAALSDLTGLWQALSGQVFDNQKLILGMPSKHDFDNLQQIHASRFNSLETSLTTLQDNVNDLIGFVQNLKLTYSDLNTAFTGHTGNTTVHN